MSLYLREPIFQKLKAMSTAQSIPSSLIVARLIEKSLQSRESNTLDALFGCLSQSNLERPEQPAHSLDSHREVL